MKGLVFIETIEDARQFRQLIYQKDKRFELIDIVSLNPNIYAYLKQNGIPCLNSASILRDNYYDVILEKCKILEEIVRINL